MSESCPTSSVLGSDQAVTSLEPEDSEGGFEDRLSGGTSILEVSDAQLAVDSLPPAAEGIQGSSFRKLRSAGVVVTHGEQVDIGRRPGRHVRVAR